MLKVDNLCINYASLSIVNNVSFELNEGKWLMLVGPNGAGKSTIVKAISQNEKYEGKVLFNGEDVGSFKSERLAQCIGVLSQYHYVSYSFSVGEVVRLGRYSYKGGFFSKNEPTAETDKIVSEALEMTGMTPYANQSVLTLSGGELQRAFLAQLFAQDPKLLILDEPTNHLDLVFQKQVFEIIKEWIKKPGRAVISVVHDLNLAKAYGDETILLSHGKIVDKGETDRVLSRENLKSVYSMDVYEWMNSLLKQWE